MIKTSVVKLDYKRKNELLVCGKVRRIPFFFCYFIPIIEEKIVNLGRMIENTLDVFEKTGFGNEKHVLIKKDASKTTGFYEFFHSLRDDKELIMQIFSSYTYLLNALTMLNKHDICFFEINPETICFNRKKQPLFCNFSTSICNNDAIDIFAKYEPTNYYIPLEAHVITFLNSNGERSLSKSNIEDICKEYIVKNNVLRIKSEEYIKNFYRECVISLLPFINKPKKDVIATILGQKRTWNIYGLSVLYLQLLNALEPTLRKSLFFEQFSLLLFQNIGTKRESPEISSANFDSLFTQDIRWKEMLL